MTKNKDSTRYASSKQEQHVARVLNGVVCPNSGAGKWSKSDVRVDGANMSIECKTSMSEKESFSVKKEWITKHKNESFANRLFNTAIAISFSPEGSENYYIIDEKLMKYLIKCLSSGCDPE